MSISELVATALPVNPTNGRARLVLTDPTGSIPLSLDDSPTFTASGLPTGPIIVLSFGVGNSPISLTPDGLSVGIGPFLEAGPIAVGVSTVTVIAYERGSIQTGTLICTVSGSSTVGASGGYGDGFYGQGLYGVGNGTGVVVGTLVAAWSSGTITVH